LPRDLRFDVILYLHRHFGERQLSATPVCVIIIAARHSLAPFSQRPVKSPHYFISQQSRCREETSDFFRRYAMMSVSAGQAFITGHFDIIYTGCRAADFGHRLSDVMLLFLTQRYFPISIAGH